MLKSFPLASSIPAMFFESLLSTPIIFSRLSTIMKRACNARDLIGLPAASGSQVAALVFRTPSNPDTFSAAAEWSSRFWRTKS